jgi:hypothetical protein
MITLSCSAVESTFEISKSILEIRDLFAFLPNHKLIVPWFRRTERDAALISMEI